MKRLTLSTLYCLGLLLTASSARATFPELFESLAGRAPLCQPEPRYISVPPGTRVSGSIETLKNPEHQISLTAENCQDDICTAGAILGFSLPQAGDENCDASDLVPAPLGLTARFAVPPEAWVTLYLRNPETAEWVHLDEFQGPEYPNKDTADLRRLLPLGSTAEIIVLLTYPQPQTCAYCGSTAVGIREIIIGD